MSLLQYLSQLYIIVVFACFACSWDRHGACNVSELLGVLVTSTFRWYSRT